MYGLDVTAGRRGEELTLVEVSWSRAPGGKRPGPALQGGVSGRRAGLRAAAGWGPGAASQEDVDALSLMLRLPAGSAAPCVHGDSAPAVF